MPVQITNAEGQYIFTAQDLEAPLGENGLSSFAAMFQRTLYKERMYPTSQIPKPLDTWYKRGLFGRVDRLQNTIIPKTINLKQIGDAKEPVFALNFVADAFSRFANHMGKAFRMGAVQKSGYKALLAPVAVAGYSDPTRQFNQFHQTLAEAFIVNFKPPREEPIEDFRTFLKYYIPFLTQLAASFPITKTNFVLSYTMDPMCNGLSVSIFDGDAADDKLKYEKFILDPNFEFYTNAAKKFGFLVDKNKPWILTADLFTKALMDRVEYYVVPVTYAPITPFNFFNVYYDSTYLTDFDDLKEILLSAYRYLVSGASLCQKETICPNGIFSYKSYPRQRYDKEALTALIDPKMLIDFYIDLRQAESSFAVDPGHIKMLRRRVYQIYKILTPSPFTPFERAAAEINKEYRRYIYPAALERLTGKLSAPLPRRAAPLPPDVAIGAAET